MSKIKYCPMCGSIIANDIPTLQILVNILFRDKLMPAITITNENFIQTKNTVINTLKLQGIFMWHDDPILTSKGLSGENYIGCTKINKNHWLELQESQNYQEQELIDYFTYYEYSPEEIQDVIITDFTPIKEEEHPFKLFKYHRKNIKELRNSITTLLNHRGKINLEYLLNYDNSDNEFSWLSSQDGRKIHQLNWTNPELNTETTLLSKFKVRARHLEEIRRQKRGIWQQLDWLDLPNITEPIYDSKNISEKSGSILTHKWGYYLNIYDSVFPAYDDIDEKFDFIQDEDWRGGYSGPVVEWGNFEGTGTGYLNIKQDKIVFQSTLNQKTTGSPVGFGRGECYIDGEGISGGRNRLYTGRKYNCSMSIGTKISSWDEGLDSNFNIVPINKGSKLKFSYTSDLTPYHREYLEVIGQQRKIDFGSYITVILSLYPIKLNENDEQINYNIYLVLNSIDPSLPIFTNYFHIPLTCTLDPQGKYIPQEINLWNILINTPEYADFIKYYDGTWDTRGLIAGSIGIYYYNLMDTIFVNPGEYGNPHERWYIGPHSAPGDVEYMEQGIPLFDYTSSATFELFDLKIVTSDILDENYVYE